MMIFYNKCVHIFFIYYERNYLLNKNFLLLILQLTWLIFIKKYIWLYLFNNRWKFYINGLRFLKKVACSVPNFFNENCHCGFNFLYHCGFDFLYGWSLRHIKLLLYSFYFIIYFSLIIIYNNIKSQRANHTHPPLPLSFHFLGCPPPPPLPPTSIYLRHRPHPCQWFFIYHLLLWILIIIYVCKAYTTHKVHNPFIGKT